MFRPGLILGRTGGLTRLANPKAGEHELTRAVCCLDWQ